eukprot:scaffold18987_cov109-Isochrysis_galbana.AAC.2
MSPPTATPPLPPGPLRSITTRHTMPCAMRHPPPPVDRRSSSPHRPQSNGGAPEPPRSCCVLCAVRACGLQKRVC